MFNRRHFKIYGKYEPVGNRTGAYEVFSLPNKNGLFGGLVWGVANHVVSHERGLKHWIKFNSRILSTYHEISEGNYTLICGRDV